MGKRSNQKQARNLKVESYSEYVKNLPLKAKIWLGIVMMFNFLKNPIDPIIWIWRYRQILKAGGDFADTDFYKFGMIQMIWRYFALICVTYELTIRTEIPIPDGFMEEYQRRINALAANHHSLSPRVGSFLRKLGYIGHDFIDWLEDSTDPKIRAEAVKVFTKNGHLKVQVSDTWMNGSWWEIQLMHMFSELYFELMGIQPTGYGFMFEAAAKGRILKRNRVPFSEFGARRRHSFKTQFWVIFAMILGGAVKREQDLGGLLGSSNVLLCTVFTRHRFQRTLHRTYVQVSADSPQLAEIVRYTWGWKETPILKMMGTIAHEMQMVLGAVYGYDKANALVTRVQRRQYGTNLGYYLPDTNTTEQFFRDGFTLDDARHLTGPRQDSGDPRHFVDVILGAYRRLGMTKEEIARKSIIFSDGLDLDKAIQYCRYAWSQGIGAAAGIGTYFTNHFRFNDWKSLNIVIKPLYAWIKGLEQNIRGCIKISDNPNKITGDIEAADEVKRWIELSAQGRDKEVVWSKRPLLSINTLGFKVT